MSQCEPHGHTVLGTAHVDYSSCVFPGECACQGVGHRCGARGHRAEKPFEPNRIGVQVSEHVSALLCFALRLPGAQGLDQRAPETLEASIEHLDNDADLAGLNGVEEASEGYPRPRKKLPS